MRYILLAMLLNSCCENPKVCEVMNKAQKKSADQHEIHGGRAY